MEQVKEFVFGVRRLAGNAKATNRAYDMCSVIVGKPIEPKVHGKGVIEGFGYESVEHDAEPSVVEQLKNVKFPCEALVTIKIEKGMRGDYRTKIVGVEQIKQPKAA